MEGGKILTHRLTSDFHEILSLLGIQSLGKVSEVYIGRDERGQGRPVWFRALEETHFLSVKELFFSILNERTM